MTTTEITKGTNSFEYNTLNQQVKAITKEGNTLVNRYDTEGLRYEIEENEALSRFIFNKNGDTLVELDQDSKVISRFTRGYDLVAADVDSEIYYYSVDEQGSTIFITDGTQQVKNEYWYDAFGNVLDSKEDIHNRITYTGQQFDKVTQQYYLRARFYNPVIGRFAQEDEYRGDGLNLYAYCENNPVRYYDPSGYSNKKRVCPDSKQVQSNAEGGSNPVTNSKGIEYPEVIDLKTGKPMEFPTGEFTRVPKDERVAWYINQNEANLHRVNDTDILCKKDFIDEWYRRGYSDPPLPWKEYDIHHIQPREFGGNASFENLTPVERRIHQTKVTPWWNSYQR